jgi:NAD(P)-dependent dehydrogenase (short-subunit alcohol dehydrogenase family)
MSQGSGHYVVLGATGGIGSATARALARSGGSVSVAARDRERVSALAAELGGEGFALDATRPEEVDACLAAARERHGRIDGVVNCVGSILLKPAHLTKTEEWSSVLAANLTSAFATVAAAARQMLRQDAGAIVLVSSAAARLGLPNHDAIAAAKAGVIGLTLAAAASYAPRGVRVNCVAPGLVRTRLSERIFANESARAGSQALHALGRLGEPEDVARAIVWLLDPAQRWVTGQVIGVDGGLGSVVSSARAGIGTSGASLPAAADARP